MKASDLRIGNYHLYHIVDKFNDPQEWDVIEKIDAQDLVYLSTPKGEKDEDYKPIPLTEEWLKKFGFETTTHYTVANSFIKRIGRGRMIIIGCVGTPNEMMCLAYQKNETSEVIDDIITIWNYDYDGKLYVHTLQNFFALTGTELIPSEN